MTNNIITTVEIKTRSITVAANRVLNANIINLFNQTFEINEEFMNSDGVITDPTNVKKILTKAFKNLDAALENFDSKDVICIVPSATYKKENKRIPLNGLNPKIGSFDDNVIEKNKNIIYKNYATHPIYEVLNVNFLEIYLDDKKFVPNQNQIGKNLAYIIEVEQINKEVFKTHKALITKAGKNVVRIIPNMQALFDSLEVKEKSTFNETLLVNWHENSIEAGYFSKNSFKKHAVINIGIKQVVKRVANRLDISEDIAKRYMFDNYDLNSINSLELFILKLKTKAGMKNYTGKQVKEVIAKELSELNKEIKTMLLSQKKFDNEDITIFNFGVINEIPNILKLIKKRATAPEFLAEMKLIGSLNNHNLFTSYGVAVQMKPEDFFVAPMVDHQTSSLPTNLQFDFMSLGIQNNYAGALFLKDDGIIIDKVKINEGNK